MVSRALPAVMSWMLFCFSTVRIFYTTSQLDCVNYYTMQEPMILNINCQKNIEI